MYRKHSAFKREAGIVVVLFTVMAASICAYAQGADLFLSLVR